MLINYKKRLEQEGVVYLLCKIFPGSGETKIKEIKKNNIDGKDIEMIYMAVSVPAVKNQANREIVKFLAKAFSLGVNNISITVGSTDRTKLIKIKK
jgi:uncharacterized protein (TIGR00251 family)